MGIISRLFGRSNASKQVRFIRQIIGKEIRRGGETFDCDTIADHILLGLPEATVITIINSWFDYRSQNPSLNRKQIFERIMKERCVDDETIKNVLSIEGLNIIGFINVLLDQVDQSGCLSDAEITAYIKKYIEATALFWSKQRKQR